MSEPRRWVSPTTINFENLGLSKLSSKGGANRRNVTYLYDEEETKRDLLFAPDKKVYLKCSLGSTAGKYEGNPTGQTVVAVSVDRSDEHDRLFINTIEDICEKLIQNQEPKFKVITPIKDAHDPEGGYLWTIVYFKVFETIKKNEEKIFTKIFDTVGNKLEFPLKPCYIRPGFNITYPVHSNKEDIRLQFLLKEIVVGKQALDNNMCTILTPLNDDEDDDDNDDQQQ